MVAIPAVESVVQAVDAFPVAQQLLFFLTHLLINLRIHTLAVVTELRDIAFCVATAASEWVFGGVSTLAIAAASGTALATAHDHALVAYYWASPGRFASVGSISIAVIIACEADALALGAIGIGAAFFVASPAMIGVDAGIGALVGAPV
jgi:hypothetical protein